MDSRELIQVLVFLSTDNSLDGFTLWLRCIGDRHEPLPYCGRNSGLLRRRLLAPHSSSLYLSCRYILLQRLACRQNGREVFPHHIAVVFRSRRIHYRCFDYNNWAKILCYDAYACWSLRRLRGGFGVDLQHSTSASCEGIHVSCPLELILIL